MRPRRCLIACCRLLSSPRWRRPPSRRTRGSMKASARSSRITVSSATAAEKHKGKLRLDDISFVHRVGRAGGSLAEDPQQAQLGRNAAGGRRSSRSASGSPSSSMRCRTTLVTARARSSATRAGRITLRRLNRREYRNTIRDLLGVEIDVRDLPTDGGTGAFDTVGASLFMSSDQIEQYLALGRRALDEHFARACGRPTRNRSRLARRPRFLATSG